MQPFDVGCFGLLQKAYHRGLQQPTGTPENPTAIMTKAILEGLLILMGKQRVMTQQRLARTLQHGYSG